MKVVFANHEPFDPGRARAIAMLRTVAAVARLTPVTLLSPDDPGRLREVFRDELQLDWPDGLTAQRLPAVYKLFGLTLNAVFLRALRREVARLSPDVLWLRSDKLAAHFARRGSQRLVYEAHMIGTLYRQDRAASARRVARYRELEQAIYERAAGVAVINAAMLGEARAMFGFQGPSAIIQGAVDPALFQPLWKGGDGRTVVYAGSMQFWKGLDTLLEAMPHAPALRLRLVGKGKPEEEAALRQSITRLGLAERVEMTGRVPQRELPARLAECACAVHPLPPGLNISERLTSPLKVFEYMATGVPLAAADVPSLNEFLRDGENARLFKPGDARALAAALTDVCSDRGLATRISRQAVADSARFTFDARARNLVRLFETVISAA